MSAIRCVFPALLLLWLARPLPATQEPEAVPHFPYQSTVGAPGLDGDAALRAVPGETDPPRTAVSGPIAAATRQPQGALSGRVVFTSAGHGWAWNGTTWVLGRPQLQGMNEDYGNLDQMTLFAYYCFNAGATVVPLRPIGHQTNEVVLDNTSPAVTWAGSWSDSSSTVFYGAPDAVPYRYATAAGSESATATYAPTIPVTGFYPVYAWALAGANRVSQLYRVNHSGGQSAVRLPHRLVGNGWVYLGSYYFEAGSNAAIASVTISNLRENAGEAGVVIADALRFGNGMGDVDRGGGVSGYPREEEASRYWVQRSVGQGQSATLYDTPSDDASDNVGAPIRMGAEMNREEEGTMFRRVYVGFHSNAGGGRGVMGLYNDPALSSNVARNSNTPNQRRLAQLLGTEVNNDLLSVPAGVLEVPWYNRGANVIFARSDYAFGEINNNTISNEFDATIVEVAFHDDASDARLMRDPKVRNWVARAGYQGLVRYFNQFDNGALVFLPEPPVNVAARQRGDRIVVTWDASPVQAGSGVPEQYLVYSSVNGYGFGAPVIVPAGGTNELEFAGIPAGATVYFRVAAANGGGESMPSETVGCRRSEDPLSSRILFVNGFTRFDRTLNLRQSPVARSYRPPGHDGNTGTIDRVLPRSVNSFDYVVPHGRAIASTGLPIGVDSCQVQATTNGAVSLQDYEIVIWAAGNQSSTDRTFNPAARERVAEFLKDGGNLFVSGSDIAWDLDRPTGPSADDRSFLRDYLHASLGGATNDNSGSHLVTPAPGSIFSGLKPATIDDGGGGIYWVGSPDALVPEADAQALLEYAGYTGGVAAVFHQKSAGGGKVLYFGFPFEGVVVESLRSQYMAVTLGTLGRPAQLKLEGSPRLGQVVLGITGEPGQRYEIQVSGDLVNWQSMATLTNASGMAVLPGIDATERPQFFQAIVRPVF